VVLTAKSLPVLALERGTPTKSPVHSVSIFGLIIVFVMLTQYNTWILMGVMDEKSSRVVEVLLAAVRPMQLLAGKVLGIGLVAFAQATLILAFALLLGDAVGSSFLHGTGPRRSGDAVVAGARYAFYCWVYAARAPRSSDRTKSRASRSPSACPSSSATSWRSPTVSTGSASSLFKVLAYVPPTAPSRCRSSSASGR